MGQNERMRPDVLKEYGNEHIVVIWEPAYCIHAKACLDNLPEVFEASRRPWILVDRASADRIAEVVMMCPTGALHFRRVDGGEPEPAPSQTTVQPQTNGPLHMRGTLKFVDANGETIREDTRAALCRCGRSEAMPFCDGMHRVIGFKAS
jgi:uncharacterized Fe-S cluster protein YjdI